MSHEQYKRDKDRGNVVGLGGDVVGWGSCGGRDIGPVLTI